MPLERSVQRHASGSAPPSPPRRPLSCRRGRRSPRASTSSSPPRPDRERRSPRSCRRSIASRAREPGGAAAGHRSRLCLAAEGALLRHRPQPAGPAARDRRRPSRRRAHRRHPQRERQAMLRQPPDILITTPESLYLMLTSRAQELFAGTRWCIVDEIHAVAPTKRGSHLALTLERLTAPRAAISSGSASPPRSARSRRCGSSSARTALPGRRHRGPQAARPEDPRPRRLDGGARRHACPGPRSAGRRWRGHPALDLACHLPELLALVRRASFDDRVRQQPPGRRASRAAAQRARGRRG